MSHASDSMVAPPEVPAVIRDRYVAHHEGFDIEGSLQALEARRPGFLDAMARMIDVLEWDPLIENTSVDIEEDTTLMPVTIWAQSSIPMEEREEHLLRFHHLAKKTMQHFNDLVLVAVM